MQVRARVLTLLVLVGVLMAQAALANAAVIGYGVNSVGFLFKFDVDAPATTTTIGGPLPFVPEGIDFRPSTNTLYAIDVGAQTTQLYTININTGASTAVGAGFPSSGSAPPAAPLPYNLTGGQTFGFDFNPKTLQASDGSIRIRLVSSGGENLRLNSDTGQIAAVDGHTLYPLNDNVGVDGVAYINNIAATAGTTVLYDLDFRNDQLAIQNPPNNGTLTAVGPFGLTIDALQGTSFDIYTDPADVDTGIGGDRGLAVLRRSDAPIGGPLGAYLLYDVNLATGALTNGRLVGSAADFTGGFAVVPEPSSFVLAAFALAGLGFIARRRQPLAV